MNIVSAELAAACEQLAAMTIERDKYKNHLGDLLKALGDDSADRIIADYRVPAIKGDGDNN